MSKYKKTLISIGVLILCFGIYTALFYPLQIMPAGEKCLVETPQPEKYMNDCLHPCVRKISDSCYVMVQSPYYAWNNKMENPIFYLSHDAKNWQDGILLAETPEYGYNSDPNVFYEDGTYYVIWRENHTPICKASGYRRAIVERHSHDGINFSEKRLLFGCNAADYDDVQCPILIKHNGKYRIYAAWYQYEPVREQIGIAIWESSSLNDDCVFANIHRGGVETPCSREAYGDIPIAGYDVFLPLPIKHDLWHFDLFEYNDKLYMVSVAENGKNIMLAVSDDYVNFDFIRNPLVSSRYNQNIENYKQRYYKPTAFVSNDSLYLYYSSIGKEDRNLNELYLSTIAWKDLERKIK